jgi:SAM-dependent methyltransferase
MVGSHSWIKHIDEGALDWALSKVTTSRNHDGGLFLDVGCGMMGMVDMAIEKGMWACGIDADIRLLERDDLPNRDRLIVSDFRKTHVSLPVDFDVIWSVEVGEHIPEQYIRNYLKTITDAMDPKHSHHPYYQATLLIFSAAPVTGNPGHCNEHPIKWWEEKFKHYGVFLHPEATEELRASSTMERNFIRDNGFIFIKEKGDAR